jgi:oligopeptide transport system ATP-binding protein
MVSQLVEDTNNNLLEIKDLQVYFPIHEGFILRRKVNDIKAVDGVSMHIKPGETLGLVGESGSGKTTVGRSIVQLQEPTAGEILFRGQNINHLGGRDKKELRRKIQFIFQDPYASLNPRMTAGSIVGEPMTVNKLVNSKGEYRDRVAELFVMVGLNPAMASRYPHEFSGGQRQRIGVARALSVSPELIVADEPVSALDVSIQAQLINLLLDIREQMNISFLFVAHDLSVVRHMADHVAVMYLGKLMEMGPKNELYEDPLHPYTRALLSAVPVPSPRLEMQRERVVLEGNVPSPINPPSGCVFHTRCPMAIDECRQVVPEFREVNPNHWVACIRV